MAASVMSNGFAKVLTELGPPLSRSTMTRRGRLRECMEHTIDRSIFCIDLKSWMSDPNCQVDS